MRLTFFRAKGMEVGVFQSLSKRLRHSSLFSFSVNAGTLARITLGCSMLGRAHVERIVHRV